MQKEQKEFNFDLLLEPYREGGTENYHVRRTQDTMLDWLIYKKKYPFDVAGAGLFILFLDLYKGKVFKGDGSYGSPGREMVTNLRFICDALLRKKLRNKFYKKIAEGNIPEVTTFMTITAVDALPFFLRPFSASWWRIIGTEKTERVTTGF